MEKGRIMENVKDTQDVLNESRAEITVDFYTIFRDVVRNLWMVIIIGISAAFLSYIEHLCFITRNIGHRLLSLYLPEEATPELMPASVRLNSWQVFSEQFWTVRF